MHVVKKKTTNLLAGSSGSIAYQLNVSLFSSTFPTQLLHIGLQRSPCRVALSWAGCVALSQSIPAFFIFSVTILPHVVLGRRFPSTLRWPCQCGSCGFILNTGPSHLHRLSCKMISVASCPVAHRSLALEILLGQNNRMILVTQVVWNVASLQLSFQSSCSTLIND